LEKLSVLRFMKNIKPWKKPKFWISLGLILLILVILTAGGIALYISSLDISKLQTPLSQPSYLYDQKGTPISQLSSSRIEPVSGKQIPLIMKQAIIAVEDRRYYEHKGVDLRSITRAIYQDFRSGDFSEGGSTITQQLAKNFFIAPNKSPDKTLTRKLKEAAYALKIETVLNKDEILTAYLNQIYFGEGRWGLQNAAQLYFGKNAEKLTLEEASLLAGMVKAPTTYSPLSNKQKSLERRNVVLSLMKEQNYITSANYEKAIGQPIVLKKGSLSDLSGQYAPYVDYVVEEAIQRTGFTEEQILNGGLQIYTQMDPSVQKAAEDVYKDSSFFPSGKADQIVQSGVVILDQSTGGIKGLVGYRGERVAFRGFNYATQLKRAPGSSLKPLSVYGPALEKGYNSNSQVSDYPLNIKGYTPTDYDNQNRGYVTIQEAISNSWNIPAVWLLNEIGVESGVDFVERSGIPLEEKDHGLPLALGGLTKGVSPLQMAQAYGVFANHGIMNKAYAIRKITTKEGDVLFQAQTDAVRVTTPSVAYRMTLMLQDVVTNGTGKNADLGRPTAGKTGSVELDGDEFSAITKGEKDVWFVGYTPELTAAVWMGYDKTDPTHYLTTAGGSEPAVVFHEILSRALKSTPVAPFEIPQEYIEQNKLSNRLYRWYQENIINPFTK
jgi:penicillin-binding protein 2A